MTYGFSFASGSISWRFPIAFQLVFSFILISTVPWLPESPRWLLAHGRHEEGIAILAALEGPNATIKDEIIVNQRDEILDAVRIEQENAPTWQEILKGKTGDTGMIKRLALGAGIFVHYGLQCTEPADFVFRNSMDAAARWNQRDELLVSVGLLRRPILPTKSFVVQAFLSFFKILLVYRTTSLAFSQHATLYHTFSSRSLDLSSSKAPGGER